MMKLMKTASDNNADSEKDNFSPDSTGIRKTIMLRMEMVTMGMTMFKMENKLKVFWQPET